MSDDFSAADFPEPFRLLVRGSVGSTNDELARLAGDGAAAGTVLLALEQTSGRGRRGAAWFAGTGEALAFSVLLRPPQARILWPRLALAAGLAVAEALDGFGVAAGIKWPNDVWIAGRKVAGILAESRSDHAVIGIGLNVNTRRFPDSLADIATSLHLATGHHHPLPDVLTAVIRRLAVRHPQIDGGFPDVLDGIRRRCVLTGRQVSLIHAGRTRSGIIDGIAGGGELIFRTALGTETLVQADEVRITG